ncbi:peptidoglycan bridge formation glycyltransferase FemA/FemB family protein [Proteiniphilum sp. UBA5384]|uniref:peptidoglycan bridge formation glycyltransferase FemA/FemB family protein n=1 Tax=Proteiniphilum sp. UBA5384 TaxID=1947279 RepID=UPI0025F72F4A|nr:peptidoglycan bridge formation glycyltransferase FemA/FemB family protein [Proteiniphilum sp. UBA5384]
MGYNVKTYYRKEELPPMEEPNFFHSPSSFDWYGNSPTYTPLMLVAFKDEVPVAAMFAVIVRINRFLKGKLFKRCFISQQPAFFEKDLSQIEIFDALISHLVKKVRNRVFVIRYEDLGNAIFGYKGFRENGFYSAKWINIRNSLQRKRNIWDQLSKTRKNQVNKAWKKGIEMEELTSEENLPEIYKLIRNTNNKKISRRFPPYQYFENFFRYYITKGKGKILLTRYQGKIIGGAILGFEKKETVYCLYDWGKSKRYRLLYPTIFTIYQAMKISEEKGFCYFDFMDVGFLNENTGRTRFLLQFGGKQRATRRWYRINWGLLNFFANRIYD